MATIKLKLFVDELDNVLSAYNRIKVYRSTTGIAGPYPEVTTVVTRIPLVQGVENYVFDDFNGDRTYYYKVSYFHSDTLAESGLSDPKLGEDKSLDLIVSVNDLKSVYLFGIDLTNDAGEPYPDLTFEWNIRWAVSWIERYMDIRICPTDFVDERYDYIRADYLMWTVTKLRESPVIKVDKYTVNWPSNEVVIDFPTDWIQLRKDTGQVNIVPTSGTLSQVLLTAGGSFLPLVASGRDFVPGILGITYTAGFEEGQVPFDLRNAIGQLASLGVLDIAGDLILGAGIATQSLSIDGLSQAIGSTSSATNAGYGARIHSYSARLKEELPVLRRYYKGISLLALG